MAPGCPCLPERASWLVSWPSVSLSVIQALIILTPMPHIRAPARRPGGFPASRLFPLPFLPPMLPCSSIRLVNETPSIFSSPVPPWSCSYSLQQHYHTLSYPISWEPGVRPNPCPGRQAHWVERQQGSPALAKKLGESGGWEGRRTMPAWTTSSPGRGQSVYPQSCHAHGHHTHGLLIRPSHHLGCCLPPLPQCHHRGLSNHRSDPVLLSQEPLLTFAGQFPHTSAHFVGTRALLLPHCDPPGPHSAHGLLRKPRGSQTRFCISSLGPEV